MVKLDLKDRKILYELDINSKQSYQSLAKKIQLSKDSTFYRVKKLQENRIIEEFVALTDVGKLGYMSFRLFIKLKNINQVKEGEVFNFFKKQKIVNWLVKVEGNWDIGMWLMCKGINELNQFSRLFKEKYINFIEKEWLSVYTKVHYFSRAYFLPEKKNNKDFIFVTEPSQIAVKQKDLEILKLLVPNSRISILEIAEKLKISPKTVISRIKNLEKDKIIIGYRTKFDLEKLGVLYYKLHIKLHNLDKQKEKELKEYIFLHPNIVYYNETISGADIELDIQVYSVKEFRNIMEEIKNKFTDIIDSYEILEYLREYKHSFLLL